MRTHGIEEHQQGVNGCLEGSGSRLLAEGASRNQKTGMLIIMTCNQYRFHISHCHQERLLLLSQTSTDNELSLLILSAFLLETGRFPQFFPAFVQGKREKEVRAADATCSRIQTPDKPPIKLPSSPERNQDKKG